MPCCGEGGGGIKYLEIFWDIGAVGGGGINHYETFQQVSIVVYGPVVSIPAYESSNSSSILTRCNIFGSRNVNHETFRDIRSAWREGGIGTAVGVSRTFPRYVSCCRSRNVPMYIAFWQLHSPLYLEKSRVIWDSVWSKRWFPTKIFDFSQKGLLGQWTLV